MLLVKEAFRASEEEGLDAGLEALLSRAHESTEFRPYVAEGRVLRGPDEVRAFFREQAAAGTTLAARPTSFEERGDEVVVTGSLRVLRPAGGFAETQVRWIYRFREGRLDEATWSPTDGG
jgi:ketosteroid isomerase-like protein